MKNLISVNLGSYRKYRDTAYVHLPTIGVHYVEIGVPRLEDVDAVRETLEFFGLSAGTLMARADLKDENIVQTYAPQFQAAQAMGVKILFTSLHRGELDKETAYRRLRAVGDEAAKYGVTIALETHPDLCENGDVALETMQAVNHPNVRLNFDTANVYYYNQNVNAVEELKKIAPYVVSVHLKDTNGGYKTWHFPTLGEGVVDFKEVFRVMNDVGMHGPFTMEMEGIQGENLNLQQTHEQMAKSMEHLRSIGAVG